MRRTLIILIGLALIGIAAWGYFGGFDRVTEQRIETALVERGVPRPMAGCMAARMTERLSLNQLRKLERLRPETGEADIPLTLPEYLERVRRVDDPEVIEVTAAAAAVCAFGGI